jgi:hypothetical protein
MSANFFDELKSVVLFEHKEDRNFLQYVRYFETLLQNRETLKPLLDDMTEWKADIHFNEDRCEGYTYGTYSIYLWRYEGEEPEDDDYSYQYDQKSPDYYYEIQLTRDEQYSGYCQCSSNMKAYNEKHNCCGIGCDWLAPAFTFRKIEEKRGVFKGLEKDIWKLEEKWDEYLASHNEKAKQEKLKRIEEQLERLQKEKEELSN